MSIKVIKDIELPEVEQAYKFEDMVSTKLIDYIVDSKDIRLPATEKQYKQIDAFINLTFVRKEILKEAGYSEDWQPEMGEEYTIISIRERFLEELNFLCFATVSRFNESVDGIELRFPNTKLAELAFEHNKELFKNYLCV